MSNGLPPPPIFNFKTDSALETLAVLAKDSHQNLVDSYPIWTKIITPPQTLSSLIDQKAPLAHEISTEERFAIFEKLRLLFANQNLLKDLEMRLYLEQQLSDLTELEVVSELDGFNLPHTLVKIQAGYHQLRGFSDQLEQHSNIHEALIDSKRSCFGWLNDKEQDEKFGIMLPLFLLEKWQQDYKKTLEWFKYRKILLINPWKKLSAVATITGIAPKYIQRYQAIANPELSRQTQLWFPGSQGRACLFLLENSQNIQPGLINC